MVLGYEMVGFMLRKELGLGYKMLVFSIKRKELGYKEAGFIL